MIEVIASIVFVAYAVIGLVYSIRMENNKKLKQIYKVKSEREWLETCWLLGFSWPVAPILNFFKRRKNERNR